MSMEGFRVIIRLNLNISIYKVFKKFNFLKHSLLEKFPMQPQPNHRLRTHLSRRSSVVAREAGYCTKGSGVESRVRHGYQTVRPWSQQS